MVELLLQLLPTQPTLGIKRREHLHQDSLDGSHELKEGEVTRGMKNQIHILFVL